MTDQTPRPPCRLCRGYGYVEVPDFSTGAPAPQVQPCPNCSEPDSVAASCGCGLLVLLAFALIIWGLQ